MNKILSVMSQKIFLCISVCLSISACTNMFFQPLKQHLASPEQYKIDYEDIYFKGSSGLDLHGWWFPAKHQQTEKVRANILFLHGNGENISTHSGLVHWLTQYHYNVFIFDYRGYGKSTGKATLVGALDDINSAREYVDGRRQQDTKLILIGHSLGASLAIYNLARQPTNIDGMVLISPFSDYEKVAQEMMSKSWLTWMFQWMAYLTVNTDYNPIDYVASLPNVPKLFVYSDEDKIIDSAHVKDLYEKASQGKEIEKFSGTHNNVFAYKENQKVLLNYLQKLSD